MKNDKISYIIAGFIVITLIILLSYLLTISFSTGRSVETEKKIYYVDYISPSMSEIIKRFNEKNKGKIEVIGINLPFEKFSTNERKELLARYLRSKGETIDLIAIDQIWTARFSKWAYPLDYVYKKISPNSILNFALNSCYYDSVLVALPIYVDISVMFYRDDLLKRLPNYNLISQKLNEGITWEDFILYFKDYKKSPVFIFQAEDYEGLVCFYSELLASLGESFIYNDSLYLEDKQVKALNFMRDLIYKYKLSPTDVTKLKENSSYEYFFKNNGLFLRAWPGFEKEALKYSENNPSIVLKKCKNPYFKFGKNRSVFGGWNIMINKNSKNIAESEKFIEFILSKEAQEILLKIDNLLPVNRQIYYDKEITKNYPNLNFYLNLFNTGFYRPQQKNYTNISDLLSYHLNSALENKIDADKALKTAKTKFINKSILIK